MWKHIYIWHLCFNDLHLYFCQVLLYFLYLVSFIQTNYNVQIQINGNAHLYLPASKYITCNTETQINRIQKKNPQTIEWGTLFRVIKISRTTNTVARLGSLLQMYWVQVYKLWQHDEVFPWDRGGETCLALMSCLCWPI